MIFRFAVWFAVWFSVMIFRFAVWFAVWFTTWLTMVMFWFIVFVFWFTGRLAIWFTGWFTIRFVGLSTRGTGLDWRIKHTRKWGVHNRAQFTTCTSRLCTCGTTSRSSRTTTGSTSSVDHWGGNCPSNEKRTKQFH